MCIEIPLTEKGASIRAGTCKQTLRVNTDKQEKTELDVEWRRFQEDFLESKPVKPKLHQEVRSCCDMTTNFRTGMHNFTQEEEIGEGVI